MKLNPMMPRQLLAVLALSLVFTPAQAQPRSNLKDVEFTRANPKFIGAFKETVAAASRGTVRVLCDGKDTALGMVVGAEGWILTKANDLRGTVTVRLGSGQEHEARITGIHIGHDLAMLKIDAEGLVPVEFQESKGVSAGSWVACAGTGQEPVAVGVISVPTRSLAVKGPLSDPAKTPYLGVSLEPTDDDIGVRVMQVVPGTPAAKVGLKADDIIIRIGTQNVATPDQFMQTLAKFKPGDDVTFRVVRGDLEIEKTTTLERRPLGSFRGEMQNRMGSELSSRRSGYGTILQHDSVVKPSDCGGPIVDLDGRVVGINICRAGRTESWAIPSEVIRPLLAELKSGKLAPGKAAAEARQMLEQQVARARTALQQAEKGESSKARDAARKTLRSLEVDLTALRTQHAVESADRLLEVMRRRLVIMNDVAAWKWNHRMEIQDPERERRLLAKLQALAGERGVAPAEVHGFFVSQFEASRLVQQERIAAWQRDNVSAPTKGTLQGELRPKLDQITDELLEIITQIHLAGPETVALVHDRLRQRSANALIGPGISEAVRARAIEGFASLQR